VDAGPLPPHPNMDPKAKFSTWKMSMTNWVRRSVDLHRPFREGPTGRSFLWHNSTRTHVWTHLAPKWQNNKSGYGLYADAIMELDTAVRLLYSRSWTTLASPTTPS